MNPGALLISAIIAAADLSTVAGHVLDERGQAIAGARVFLEQGMGGGIQTTQSRADGAYRFENVLPGLSGVFADAPGYAIDGRSVRIAIAQTTQDTDLILRRAGTISGTIRDPGGAPLRGARITRVLLRNRKVGIPFAKLAPFGIAEARSDDRGRFTINSLPRDEPVALKIAHPRFAQEAAVDIKVGDRNVKIALSRGVLITGTVLVRGSGTLVSSATIFFQNTDPLRGTVITRSGVDGAFSLRLRPGAYIFDASGSTFRTPNLQRVIVTGKYAAQNVVVHVAGTAVLKGLVLDALSGGPVRDARLLLEAYGVPSAMTRTGPTGEFEFTAAEGENVVKLDHAPGYMFPAEPALRLQVTAGQPIEVPTFWLAPVPEYALEVIDRDNRPVSGAVVRILRPAQFGWRTTDVNGNVTLTFASLPSDGTVVGIVDHPSQADGALFAITRDRSQDAIVRLVPFGQVEGTVRSAKGGGLAGVAVESRFSAESFPETLSLWRTITSSGGAFRWNGVPRYIPQLCLATTMDKDGQLFTSGSTPFILNDEPLLKLDDIVVTGGGAGRSTLGRRLKWSDNTLLCGMLPAKEERQGPAVVIFTGASAAAPVAEAMQEAMKVLNRPQLHFALIVDGDTACPDVSFPILKGEAPAEATTYLLDAEGTVVLETFGLPPLFGINEIAPQVP